MQFDEDKTGAVDAHKVPTDIRYHRRSRVLELIYVDNKTFNLSSEYLRVYSPSAEVRGHGVGQEVLQHGKKEINILQIEARGHYAIQLLFDDKHDSGIYTWDYLYELGENEQHYWEAYLQKLHDAGKSRDTAVQPLKFHVGSFDPLKKP